MNEETQLIRDRYSKRKQTINQDLYNPLRSSVYMAVQEKERALINWINKFGIIPTNNKRILEIGCGTGKNLLQLIHLGFKPENLIGNELLEERAEQARSLLPSSSQIIVGDASTLQFADNSFDIVSQSTVFSSILDNEFQEKLASQMWRFVKPGGGILWYDFIYNNPNNPDVRGMPIKRIIELFPEGKIKVWRITLAPPIARYVTRVHPSLYNLLNLIPLIRTHVLVWIQKK